MSEKQPEGRKPDYLAYTVKDNPNGGGYWNKIGAAWEHKDGQGLEINLETIPLDGRVTLRHLREEQMESYEAERQNQPAHDEPNRARTRGRSR